MLAGAADAARGERRVDERGRGARARAARARPARSSCSPAGTARARSTCSSTPASGEAGRSRSPGERHPDGAAHGSGCTHSSVLAAQLALGRTPLQAARAARALAGEAVADGLRDVGAGAGPVDVIGLGAHRGLSAPRR